MLNTLLVGNLLLGIILISLLIIFLFRNQEQHSPNLSNKEKINQDLKKIKEQIDW